MDAHDLLARLPEFVDVDAVRNVDAIIQYDVERPLWHEIRDGEVQVHDGRADAPDLVVGASDALLLELFRGEANPTMAIMTGRLKVKGDMRLARDLVSLVDQDKLDSLT